MVRNHTRFAAFVAAAVLLPAVHAQHFSQQARPTARVVETVDSAEMKQLAGTHPRIVDRAILGSALASGIPLTSLRLVLTPGADQVTAMRSFMDEQQDKSSPNFHKWLTPDSFGEHFGVADADIAKVTAWLQDQGFTVNSVAKSKRLITFSGTSGQVETAFHTQIRRLTVNGEAHISNVTDISVPAALSPVVGGVASLNDFYPKSNIVNPHKAEITVDIPANNLVTPTGTAQYTSPTSGSHYVSPGDAAVIFNSTPLLNAGIDGTGQTIAVLGRSNISLSDVQQFRSMFGLKKNDPTITVLGNDPGLNGDDLEAYLDVEWSGGMAPGANVDFIVGGPDYYFSSGIDAAGEYAVENNIGDVITLSYGGCETNDGASGTAFWNSLWEQAAAQGQTVFVSSGDSSAAGCQSSSALYGTAYGVNALGSSAYNVAVGGSMFVDYNPSQYWSAGQTVPVPAGYTFTTATSYIPEAPWNEGALSTTYLNAAGTAPVTGSGIVGGGGGVSLYTARPSWQTGSGISPTADSVPVSGTGIAANSPITGVHRLVPDISFIAASGHDATIFCGEGVCSNTNSGYSIGAIGGTSVATPVMASVQALINQKNGGRQGNANFYYYPLANNDYVAGNCKSLNGTAASPMVALPDATCNFHDLVTGSNAVKQNAADTTGLGFNAGTGFDSASGLGTVNINNVATNWQSVSFTATTTTFTLSPTAGILHGAAQMLNVTVKPTTGSGTPTGDFALIAETVNAGSQLQYTLTGGAFSGSINGLPAGSYNVHVHYEGDGTFGGSDSASVPVTIGQENSSLTSTLHYITGTSLFTSPTSVPYDVVLFLDTLITPVSNSTTIPAGTVTYTVALNGTTIGSTTQTVDGGGNTSFQSGANSTPLYLKGNFPVLTPGSYVITASYSGDSTYAAASSTTTFAVVPIAPTVSLTSSTAYTTTATPVTLNYSVTRPAGTYVSPQGVFPTGTVTFTDTTTATVLGSAPLNANGIATLTTTGITATGSNAIAAMYPGDTNYSKTTSTVTVTVGTQAATATSLSAVAGTYYVGSSVALSATVTPATAGTVRFYNSGILLGSATSSATTGVATLAYSGLPAGTENLSATFAGTATYASSTGTTSLVVSQNVTTLILDSPAVSVFGQTIFLNGRLSRNPSSGTAPLVGLTGTVSFYDGATSLGSATPVFLPGGYGFYTATFTAPVLGAGPHTITATYSGDSNYAAANSASVTLSVAKLTPMLTLTAPATVYNSGSSVVLTATLPAALTFAAPVGTLTFYDGSNLLGTGVLSYSPVVGGYVATLTTSSLPSGLHTITAVLSPDANYDSAAATLSIMVNTNNVWVANGNGTTSGVTSSGGVVTPAGLSGGGTAIAIDNSGNVWSLSKPANSVTEFTKAGSKMGTFTGSGNIVAPTALAIDGAGIVWIANGLTGLTGVTPTGATISANPYTPGLSAPTAIKVDASGDLWITNTGDNSLVEVIGLATPATTPQTVAVKNATPAAKP